MVILAHKLLLFSFQCLASKKKGTVTSVIYLAEELQRKYGYGYEIIHVYGFITFVLEQFFLLFKKDTLMVKQFNLNL